MKQKDITLIVVIVIVSGFLSLVISNIFISSAKNRSAKVEVVDSIDDEFPQPDRKYFNQDSIDPTKNIRIGNNANNDPFNGQ